MVNAKPMDWSSIQDQVTDVLGNLVRFNTSNPPGNETPAAEYLAGILRREGLQPEVVESAPGRGSVIARVRGSGAAPPLILLSHLDVVPAEVDKWKHDPFGGDIVDGYVWGRGTVDCKGLTAIELMALLSLVRQNVPLKRDIIFAATADEETGGAAGPGWIIANRPALLDGAWCINEGGGDAFSLAGKTVFTCQTAEKGSSGFKVIARGPAGHASVPLPDNSVILLSRAMQRLGEASLPLHSTSTMLRCLGQIASLLGGDLSVDALLRLADDRTALAGVLGSRPLANTVYAMLHNTLSPTMLKAGERLNVIPSVAEGWIDGRILPGQNQESFRAEILGALGDLPVEIEFLRKPALALESPPEGELFDTICEVIAAHEPAAPVVPILLTGGTDAKHLAPAGVRVYGFWPMREDPQARLMEMAHNHDERISLANLRFGVHVLYHVIKQFCAA